MRSAILALLANAIVVAVVTTRHGAAQTTAPRTAALPPGLVYLSDIAPGIQQDIRYAGANNFTGTRLPGYDAAECILTRDTATALALVQADLASTALSLQVYDCYRPERASRAMTAWVNAASTSRTMNPAYNPHVPRGRLTALGYIASRSTHSRGDTVDLTLVAIEPVQRFARPDATAIACTAPIEVRQPDPSVDMGTAYDCFDPRSNTRSPEITASQREWRTRLVRAMRQHGFVNYDKEWWHFTHRTGGGPSYDFPIPPRPRVP